MRTHKRREVRRGHRNGAAIAAVKYGYDSDMGSSDGHRSRPVFIVGSPRSGTSVLTWALGQHPNLLLTEESNWLGTFAIQAAAAYSQGSARARRSQLGALGISRDAFLSGFGDAIDRMILAGRSHLEASSRADARVSPQRVNPEFAISRNFGESKSRWIDGTPEYSLQIPALIALFPQARFVHLLRDADQVAASLLAFRDEGGRLIVGSAEDAYAYWMRTVRACLDAEEILGPGRVHRVRHADLVVDGERTLRGILEFLGEPFVPACLEPLKHRINSSFGGEAMPRAFPDARSAVIEEARRASAAWLASSQSTQVGAASRACWDADFDVSVLHAQNLQTNWEVAQRMLSQTRLAFGVCGMLLFVNWLLALALWIRTGDAAVAFWQGLACATVMVYLWMRRAGLRSIATRVLGMVAGAVRRSG